MKILIYIPFIFVLSHQACAQSYGRKNLRSKSSSSLRSKTDSTKFFETFKGKMLYPIISTEEEIKSDLKENHYRKEIEETLSTNITLIRKEPLDIFAIFDGTVILLSDFDSSNYTVTLKFGSYYISYSNIEKANFFVGQKIKMGDRFSRMRKNIDGEYALDLYLSKATKDLNIFDWICP